MTVGQNDIVAKTRFEHANCVLDVAPGSIRILAYIGGRKPEMLGYQIRGNKTLIGSRREHAVTDQSVHIFLFEPRIRNRVYARFQVKAE
jgi:hypothetical protein